MGIGSVAAGRATGGTDDPVTAAEVLPRPFWAGDYLNAREANRHFCVVGATGSGKTLTLLLLMQSVLPSLAPGRDQRAVIYDAKQDVLSYLYPMVRGGGSSASGGAVPVRILNPFDRRGARWEMAKDVTSLLAAQQVAGVFVPEEPQSNNRYFSDAARHLVTGILVALLHHTQPRGRLWTLRDVLLIARSRDLMWRLFDGCPHTGHLNLYLDDETREATSILTTLATKLFPFEPIAAAWHRAKDSFCLRDWLQESSILVLGNDEAARSALDAVNRALFKRATELVLGQSENERRRTWFFLDEVREAGVLDGLSRLLTKGRSKGACVVLGFQDIEGMREAYGDNVANEVVGQCGSKAILRLASPETAQWASGLRGTYLRWEPQTSESQSSSQSEQGRSTSSERSTSLSLQERQAVYSSEFFDLPFPRPVAAGGPGMAGYYITAEGFYKKTFDPFPLLPRRDPLVRDFWPRPESEQFLAPWDRDDEERIFGKSPAQIPPSDQLDEHGNPEATGEGDAPQDGQMDGQAGGDERETAGDPDAGGAAAASARGVEPGATASATLGAGGGAADGVRRAEAALATVRRRTGRAEEGGESDAGAKEEP